MPAKTTYQRPWKLGFADGSGKDDYWISDDKDNAVLHGQGDCCHVGGIQDGDVAQEILTAINSHAALVAALRAIEEAADEAQGEWVGIEVPYAPAWTMPLKDIADQARAALAAAGEPEAAPTETPEQDVERRR